MDKNEFLQKLKDANAEALRRYRKEDDEYKRKIAENGQYIDMYLNLIASAIKNYDYRNDCFNVERIAQESQRVLGGCAKIDAHIGEEIDDRNVNSNKGVIELTYNSDGNGSLLDAPSFFRKMDRDFVFGELSDEYGVSVSTTRPNWNDYKTVYKFVFDASIITTTKEALKQAMQEESHHTK